jgi:hypothetical protein
VLVATKVLVAELAVVAAVDLAVVVVVVVDLEAVVVSKIIARKLPIS